MKKFNKSKVIIPALAMIALSTAASATGTVAWFAANSTVEATGMSFTASASANLFIGASDTATLNALTASTINLNTKFNAIKPCTLVDGTGASAGTVTVKNATGYAENAAPSYDSAGTANAFDDIGTITAAPSANANNPDPLDNYIAHAHVKIARKQNPKAYFALTPTVTLTFTPKSSPLNKALRAGWIINGFYQDLVGNGLTDEMYNAGKAVFEGTKVEHLADNSLIDVALMVWYEGSDEDCKTANAINIAECGASWSFASSDSTAPQNQQQGN